MPKPKHIQEMNHREGNRVCDHSDIVIDEEAGVVECDGCGMSQEIEPDDLDVDITKPSMRRARIRELMRELQQQGEFR